MQREERPVMATGLERMRAESSVQAEAPLYVIGPPHHGGTGMGESVPHPV